MNKPHEPGEPTPEDLAQEYSEMLDRLHGIREMFLAKQQMSSLSGLQTDNMFQRFETDQIEIILAGLEGKVAIPWKAHPDTIDVDAGDSDAAADTFIDPVGKKVVRYETTDVQGTEQIEIIMTYNINEAGRLERLIATETEEIPDTLRDNEAGRFERLIAPETEETPEALRNADHPAFVPLDLPNGERVNVSSAPDEATKIELDLKQSTDFVAMMREITAKLAKIYNQKGWEIMFDTDRSPQGVEPGDYRAVYKIERLEID